MKRKSRVKVREKCRRRRQVQLKRIVHALSWRERRGTGRRRRGNERVREGDGKEVCTFGIRNLKLTSANKKYFTPHHH